MKLTLTCTNPRSLRDEIEALRGLDHFAGWQFSDVKENPSGGYLAYGHAPESSATNPNAIQNNARFTQKYALSGGKEVENLEGQEIQWRAANKQIEKENARAAIGIRRRERINRFKY